MSENLQQSFLRFCKTNQFEINPKQVEVINLLENFISIKKKESIDNLIEKIVNHLESITPKNNVFLTRERHVQGVKNALKCLKNILKIDLNSFPELASEELRVAAKEIGSITNVIDAEEVLDDIFSNFCIGK